MTMQFTAPIPFDPEWVNKTAPRFFREATRELDEAKRELDEVKEKEDAGCEPCKAKEELEAAKLAPLLGQITERMLSFHQNLTQQIAAWRSGVASGAVVYDERDDRSFRFALGKGIAMIEDQSWQSLAAIAQNGGRPLRGVDALNDRIEEARKMLQVGPANHAFRFCRPRGPHRASEPSASFPHSSEVPYARRPVGCRRGRIGGTAGGL